MAQVVTPETVSRSVKTMTLSYSKNFQDEAVDFETIAANYVVDVNGYIYQNSKHSTSCSVCFLSGDHRFMHEKTPREGIVFLTHEQIVAMSQIMRALAKHSRRATIEAEDDRLYYNAVSLYRSYLN